MLNLVCGNGVLAKSILKTVKYTDIDLSESLIKYAKNGDKNSNHKYIVGDVTKPLNLPEEFNRAVIILVLQNIQNPLRVFENASRFLIPNSRFLIVLNHPAFRIPRQTSLGVDEGRKIQYRQVDKYMSPMKIPIYTNPSDLRIQITMNYHLPISDYSKMLKDSGFVIELIGEWISDKESQGKASRMENCGGSEIPFFIAISAIKK